MFHTLMILGLVVCAIAVLLTWAGYDLSGLVPPVIVGVTGSALIVSLGLRCRSRYL